MKRAMGCLEGSAASCGSGYQSTASSSTSPFLFVTLVTSLERDMLISYPSGFAKINIFLKEHVLVMPVSLLVPRTLPTVAQHRGLAHTSSHKRVLNE